MIEKALDAPDTGNDAKIDILDSWEEGKVDLEKTKIITDFNYGFIGNAPLVLSKLVNLKETFGIQSILDIGGGSGCYR
jgi:hypothetical protein